MSNATLELTQDEEQVFQKMADRLQKKPKLDTRTILLSEHGYDMMADRFDQKNRGIALEVIRGWLNKATYICESVNESNSRTHVYGVYVKQGLAASIHVNMSYEKIVTVINIPLVQHRIPEIMRDKVYTLYRSELRKLGAKEKRLLDKTDLILAEINAEIYPLKLQILKTSSEKKKSEYRERISELELKIVDHYSAIKDVQHKIRQVVKSMITLL